MLISLLFIQSAGVEITADVHPKAGPHAASMQGASAGGPRMQIPQQRVGVLMIQLCSATLRFTTPISPAVKISIGKQVHRA